MPFIYVIFSFVMLYIIFFTFIRSTGLLQPDECLEILQSVDEALAEATEPDYDPLGQEDARKEDLEATKKLDVFQDSSSVDSDSDSGESSSDDGGAGSNKDGDEGIKKNIGTSVYMRRRVVNLPHSR